MNVLFLTTHTPNCEPFWRSLEVAGHTVKVERYDDRPHDRHHELVSLVETLTPDVVVYIGAYAPSHGGPVPGPETFCGIRRHRPLILLCGDAADDPWWPVLEDYHRRKCFTVMVAIDGNHGTPIAGFAEGLTLLTPIDTRVYSPVPWEQRSIKLGMVGGTGHRWGMVSDLIERGLIDYRRGPAGRSYREFAELLCQTKITLNLAQTGTGKYLHVKGRVIEAGFAGSVVLETRGSPLSSWFAPGIEYLEYSDANEIARFVGLDDDELRLMAERFHARMRNEHSPAIFWEKVLSKCSVFQ